MSFLQVTLRTYRDKIRQISPPWLQLGQNEKILYAIAVQLDAAGDAITAAIKLRFPGVYTDESLPLIGRERRIRRGRSEAAEPYALRLRRWFEDHRRRGGPYALLAQLYAHYAPDTFPIHLVYRSGMRFIMDSDGVVTRDYFPGADTLEWAHWRLIYFSDLFTPADAEDIVLIPREWIAAHIVGEVVVLPPGGELWNYPVEMLWDQTGTWDTADVSLQLPVNAGI